MNSSSIDKTGFHINFLNYPTTSSNDKTKYEKYFLNYNPQDWKLGSGGASFMYEDSAGKKYSIVVVENEKYGFLLMYEPSDNGCYSLGDKNLLNDFFENDDGIIMPSGTYISPEKAWLVIVDFLTNPTKQSDKIQWVSDNDINWRDDLY